MAKLNPDKVKYLVVHCSASQAKSNLSAKDIDRMHRQRGFLKIGYHYVIKRDGTVEAGRPETEVGAHVEGYNSVSLGICMVGGIDAKGKPEDNFTLDQYASLGKLLEELSKRYPKAVILGHRDMPNVKKDCPCFDVKTWWKDTVLNTTATNPITRADTAALLK